VKNNTNDKMKPVETLIEGSAKAHGHLCPGQVIGVRMAVLGLELIGLSNPKETSQIKKLIVYVEMDRCATDAISYVTGVTLGRRSLKFMDYGIMAATFVNLETKKAFRILSLEKSRDLAKDYATGIEDNHLQQTKAYKIMPLSELFEVCEVQVNLHDSDMPGPSRYKAVCEKCQIVIRDRKEITRNGKILCHSCGLGGYYKNKSRIILT